MTHALIGRRSLGALFMGVAVLLILRQEAVRVVEAAITARVVDPVTIGSASSSRCVIFFGIGSGKLFGLMITPLCSNVVLMVPLLFLAGVLLAVARMRTGRALLGLAVGMSVALGANLLRYASAAIALQRWGVPGFDLVHEYAGSLVVITGFGLGMALCLRIASGGRHRDNQPFGRDASRGQVDQ